MTAGCHSRDGPGRRMRAMAPPRLAFLLATAIAALGADRIEFRDGEISEGEIAAEIGADGKVPDTVTVGVPAGKISFPAARIARVRLDLKTREAAPAADLVRLGRLAEALASPSEALSAYEAAGAKDPALLETFERAADVGERIRQFARAAAALERLAAARPADGDLRRRLERARAEAKAAGQAEPPPATIVQPDPPVPPPPPVARSPDDLLETDPTWRFETWNDCAEGAWQIVANRANTNRYLGLHWDGLKGKGKLALSRLAPPSATRVFRFDAFNASSLPVEIALAADDGAGRYLESRTVSLAPGKWKLGASFDFRQKAFKSAQTGWADYSDSFADGVRVQKVFVLVYPGALEKGFVYVDALQSPPES